MTERTGRHAAGRGRSGASRLSWLPRPRLGGGTGDSASQAGDSAWQAGRPERSDPREFGRDRGDQRVSGAAGSSRPHVVLGNPVVRGRPPAAAGGHPSQSGGNVPDGLRPGDAGRPPAGGDGALRPLPGSGWPAGPAAPGLTAQTSRAAAGSASRLRFVWVYPDLLSTYGDRGNLLVLQRRARLRGIDVEATEVNADQPVPIQGDIYLIGGGEDLPQILAANRLRSDGGLAKAARHGGVVFAVCAGYQVMGHEFGGVEGEPVEGLGLLDITSGRGQRRGVGELVADVEPDLGVPRLTGFENHQGITRIGPGARPLARVSRGVGNGDGTEGAVAGRVLGTYMHGPALARNPGLADLLLTWAAGPLPPIDPAAEEWAARLRAERMAATAQ